jgi:hypothetical protein
MGFGVTSADPALSDVVPMGISHFKLRAVKPRNVATVAARCSVMVEACPFHLFHGSSARLRIVAGMPHALTKD